MPDLMLDLPPVQPDDAQPGLARPSPMHEVLLESRRRWRHLVTLAADLAIETDAEGRIVFVLPDAALGWPPGALIGQPADLLLPDESANAGFDPFRITGEVRHHRCWLRRSDGTLSMMGVSAGPILGPEGRMSGTRVTAVDLNALDRLPAALSARLRHGDVLDQVLRRVGQETEVDGMMDAALWSILQALEAEGAAVLAALMDDAAIELIHECGPGGAAVAGLAARMLHDDPAGPEGAENADGRQVLAVACPSRFSATSRLAVWRPAGAPAWQPEDARLLASAAVVVRMILDHEAMLQRMAEQARTDPLTGLLNRRAFLEEIRRDLVRLDRDPGPASLMFLDVDSFKRVNDRFGHAAGDALLMILADALRRLVRSSDLIARVGGDEFAVWLGGADHMTAAERANELCKSAPAAFRRGLESMRLPDLGVADPGLADPGLADPGVADPGVADPGWADPVLPDIALPDIAPDDSPGLSIGIATRSAGSRETVQDLMHRADLAMYEVKRGGRGHWRVALLAPPA